MEGPVLANISQVKNLSAVPVAFRLPELAIDQMCIKDKPIANLIHHSSKLKSSKLCAALF